MIERAEAVLRDLGFRICRVRHHDTIARLELGPDEMARAIDPRRRGDDRSRAARPWLRPRDDRSPRLSARQPERSIAPAPRLTLRTRLAALAALFLATHLAFLPPTLEDIDSINFAMGVRHFDVAASSAASTRVPGVHRSRKDQHGGDEGAPRARGGIARAVVLERGLRRSADTAAVLPVSGRSTTMTGTRSGPRLSPHAHRCSGPPRRGRSAMSRVLRLRSPHRRYL